MTNRKGWDLRDFFQKIEEYIFSERALVIAYDLNRSEIISRLRNVVLLPHGGARHSASIPGSSVLGNVSVDKVILYKNVPPFFLVFWGAYSFEGRFRASEEGCVLEGKFRPPQIYKAIYASIGAVFALFLIFGLGFVIKFYSTGGQAAFEFHTVLLAMAVSGVGLFGCWLTPLKVAAFLERGNFNAVRNLLFQLREDSKSQGNNV